MTEPLLPNTFPKRVVIKRVLPDCRPLLIAMLRLCTYISAKRLEAPMTLVGLTALSVETMMNLSTSYLTAISATLRVP